MGINNYANIMMIGKTGVGKSSFLNYLLNINDIPTGKGKPVTQGFNMYEFENVDGLPLRVFDSKGLEVEDLSRIKSDIINYIRTACGKSNPMDWLHSIFYCVNVKSARFQDEEINFIKDICKSISQSVHIIITHCDSPEDQNVKEMEAHIRSVLPGNISVIKVNSVDHKKRTQEVIKAFGRDEALETIFSVLWKDIATRVSNEYATEFYNSLQKHTAILSNTFDSVTARLTTLNVIKEVFNEGGLDSILDSASNKFEREIENEKNRLSNKYTEIINPIIEFYNNYSNGLGYSISLLEYDDFMPDRCVEQIENIDIDDILEHSRMGRIINEVDNIDDSSIFGVLKMAGKMISMLMRIQSLFREVSNDIMREFRKALPTKDEIAKEMYDELMEQVY